MNLNESLLIYEAKPFTSIYVETSVESKKALAKKQAEEEAKAAAEAEAKAAAEAEEAATEAPAEA